MLPPVGIIQVCVTDGIAAVNHDVFADIDAAVRDARNAAHRAFEKHNIAGFGFIVRNFPAQVEESRSTQTARVIHTAIGEYVADEA